MSRTLRRLLAAGLALVAALVSPPSSAHTVGVSRGEYRRVATGLEASLAFARPEVQALGGATALAARLDVRGQSPCRLEHTTSTELERDGVQIDVEFRCSEGGPLHVSFARLLADLERGHRHEAVNVESGASTLFYEPHADWLVTSEKSPAAIAQEPESRATRALGFVRLGIEHILGGLDHLVFLIGLVVVGLSARRTIVVASAFALAHSISLAACVLGGWTPPSFIVEPAIALSIAYVGVENLVGKGHERRGWLAFGFGLVHGTGFASALADVKFRGLELVAALAGFNAGVELGQLLVLAFLLPLLTFLVSRPVFARHGVRAVSAAVASAGIVWFATRVYALA